jgi:hypothetical protein
MRDPEDDDAAREALEEWLKDRPHAAIVVATIDRLPDDTLDIGMKLSRLTGYHLIGLAQALLQQAIEMAEASGSVLDPELEKLRQAIALLDTESEPTTIN